MDNTTFEITENELLEELAKSIEQDMMKPDDVTRSKLQKRTGLKRSAVESYLEGRVEKGLLIKVWAINPENGKWGWAYRRAVE